MSNSVNGLRIKTDATATGSTVSSVVYSGNTLSGITSYGLLIDQSYPSTLGSFPTSYYSQILLNILNDSYPGHGCRHQRTNSHQCPLIDAENFCYSGSDVLRNKHNLRGKLCSSRGSQLRQYKQLHRVSSLNINPATVGIVIVCRRTWNFAGLTVTGMWTITHPVKYAR